LWDSNRDPAPDRKSAARHPLNGSHELVIALQPGKPHRCIPHVRHQPTQRPCRRMAERRVADKLPQRHAIKPAVWDGMGRKLADRRADADGSGHGLTPATAAKQIAHGVLHGQPEPRLHRAAGIAVAGEEFARRWRR
jgi:hypothetical protein